MKRLSDIAKLIKDYWFLITILGGCFSGCASLVHNYVIMPQINGHIAKVSKLEAKALFQDSLLSQIRKERKAEVDTAIKKHMAMATLTNAVGEIRGLDTQGSMDYIKKTLDFADRKRKEDSIWHDIYKPFIDGVIDEKENFIRCGFILSDSHTGLPTYFRDCRNKDRKIYHGIPVGSNLRNKVFYYRDENDNPIILHHISNVMIN